MFAVPAIATIHTDPKIRILGSASIKQNDIAGSIRIRERLGHRFIRLIVRDHV